MFYFNFISIVRNSGAFLESSTRSNAPQKSYAPIGLWHGTEATVTNGHYELTR